MRRASHEEPQFSRNSNPPVRRRFSAAGRELTAADDASDVGDWDTPLVMDQANPREPLRVSRPRPALRPPVASSGSRASPASGVGGSNSSGRVSLLSQQIRGSSGGSDTSSAGTSPLQGATERPTLPRRTTMRSALSAELRQHEAAAAAAVTKLEPTQPAVPSTLRSAGRSSSTPLPALAPGGGPPRVRRCGPTRLPSSVTWNAGACPATSEMQRTMASAAVQGLAEQLGGMALAFSVSSPMQQCQQQQQPQRRRDLRSHSHGAVESLATPSPSFSSLRRSEAPGSPTAVPGGPPPEAGRWLIDHMGPGAVQLLQHLAPWVTNHI